MHIRFTIFIVFTILIAANSFAQASSRFLYLENCSGFEIDEIHIETQSDREPSEWRKSGRAWDQAPLRPDQAACFDVADMFGDVPNGTPVRLSFKLENAAEFDCPASQADKTKEGALRLFTYVSEGLFSEREFLIEGCHARAVIDWQPEKRCRGQGGRFSKIQCEPS